MRDSTLILGILLAVYTVVVCVVALWVMGPARTRRVERSRREPW